MATCAKSPLFRAGTLNTSILRAGMTARQVQLCDALMSSMGISNAELARKLGITEGTTRHHIHHLFLIFRVTTRAQLVVELHRYGYSVPS
jgi:DNA-binding CsgD family transcriptional regulator